MPKYGEVRRRLQRDGWRIARQRGSHEQWKHPEKPERLVTLAGADSKDIPPGMWSQIQRDAGWK
ncbi:MAG: type II toxin-antitoxin system HicA family toxin [Chloroflexi bacterium]|nr:type II toxin-antitoxin system HicA family toxin [Chloroflexota bacterium]